MEKEKLVIVNISYFKNLLEHKEELDSFLYNTPIGKIDNNFIESNYTTIDMNIFNKAIRIIKKKIKGR